MKKYTLYLFLAAVIGTVSVSCSEEELNKTSIITDPDEQGLDGFAFWLHQNYLMPYNIDVVYKMKDTESDMNYNLVPADYDKSVQLAKLTHFLCLQPYDEITGSTDFIRQNYPKLLHFIGSPAVRNNGTEVIGTAEGGAKITLYNVNALNVNNLAHMNEYFFKTQHHEFGHILNQKKPFSKDFDAVSGAKYVNDSWNTVYPSTSAALRDGFISPYSSSAPGEDFVELVSIYILNTPEQWNWFLTTANTGVNSDGNPAAGRALIEAKFDMVYNYMLNSWNIDLTKLREIVLRRQSEINTLGL